MSMSVGCRSHTLDNEKNSDQNRVRQWLPDFPKVVLASRQPPVDLGGFTTAKDLAVSHHNDHLYILTYTTLYQLNTTDFTIEDTYDTRYERGRGFLSIAISPDDDTILVYKMPDSVVVLTASELTVMDTIEVAASDYKTNLLFHPNSKAAYALSDRGIVSGIDLQSGKVSETVKLDYEPAKFAISQDGNHLCVSYRSRNVISVLATQSLELVEDVVVVPQQQRSLISSLFSPGPELNAVSFHPRENRLYVQSVGLGFPSADRADTIFAIDLQSNALVGKSTVGMGASRLQFAFGGEYLFLTDKGHVEGRSFTTVVDPRTLEATHHMIFPDGFNDYVINEKTNTLYTISYEEEPRLNAFQLVEPE